MAGTPLTALGAWPSLPRHSLLRGVAHQSRPPLHRPGGVVFPLRSAAAPASAPRGLEAGCPCSVSLPPAAVELGSPFAWEFCSRLGSAVTSQRAGPAAAMVAKDYPFYLTVKRANCSLEVSPGSGAAKDAEVGRALHLAPSGCLRGALSLHRSLSWSPGTGWLSSLTLCVPVAFSLSLTSSASPIVIPHPVCLPSPLWVKHELLDCSLSVLVFLSLLAWERLLLVTASPAQASSVARRTWTPRLDPEAPTATL